MTTRKRSRKDTIITRPVSHFDNLDRRYQHALCLLFLFILPFFQYSDVLLGDQRFMAHDIVQWRASAESIIEHREVHGEEPLWSTNMFSGMPAYIISFMRSVPHFDNVYTWLSPIFPAVPLWVMMLGMYLFLLRLKLHPLAAAVGALLVAMTTYMPIIVGAGHNAKVYALTFIPYMLYGFHMLTRSDNKLLGFAVFALAVNLELRAGHPQVTYFFLFLFAAWWIHDLIKAWQEKSVPQWAKNTGFLIAAGLLALAANAQPMWSIYEYSPYSIRGGAPAAETTGLDLDYAMQWSHGWFELSTFFIPGIKGGSSTDNLYWGDKIFTSGPHYLGAIAFFLGLLAIFKVKSSLKWVFLSAAILTMLFSLGKNFSSFNNLFFNYFPFYNKFRAPEMWLMVSTLSFCALAAMGANWLFTAEKDTKKVLSLQSVYFPAGLALGTGLLYLLLVNSVLSFEKPGERTMLANQVAQQNQVDPNDPRVRQVVNDFLNNDIKPARIEKAQRDTIWFLIFTGFGLLFTALFILAKIPAYIAVGGMLVILALDLITVGSRYLPEDATIPKAWDLEQAIERQRTSYHDFIQGEMADFPYPYRVFPIDSNPFNNAVPAYFYPSIGGYTGAKMNRYQDVIDQAIFSDATGINFGVMDMLNVRYITVRQPFPLPGFETVYQGNSGSVMESSTVLPKVFFPDDVVIAERPSEALAFLQHEFDPASLSIIEIDTLSEHRADSLATFEMTEYQARRISFDVTKNEPGWVLLSEMYYPKGWNAFVNGEKVPIYAANYLLRAIHLEPGDHEVEFVFAPASYYTGRIISWTVNVLIMGLLLLGLFLTNRPKTEPATS